MRMSVKADLRTPQEHKARYGEEYEGDWQGWLVAPARVVFHSLLYGISSARYTIDS